MCEHIGCEVVFTTSAYDPTLGDEQESTPAMMAQLVEYAYGDANTTWGAQRVADGHAQPYKMKYIELGNEQYNPLWAEQVQAMQARAQQLGVAEEITYFWPKGRCTKVRLGFRVSG